MIFFWMKIRHWESKHAVGILFSCLLSSLFSKVSFWESYLTELLECCLFPFSTNEIYRYRFKAVKREEEINQQSQELADFRKNYASESEKVRVVRFLSFFLFSVFLFFFFLWKAMKLLKLPQHVIHEFWKRNFLAFWNFRSFISSLLHSRFWCRPPSVAWRH